MTSGDTPEAWSSPAGPTPPSDPTAAPEPKPAAEPAAAPVPLAPTAPVQPASAGPYSVQPYSVQPYSSYPYSTPPQPSPAQPVPAQPLPAQPLSAQPVPHQSTAVQSTAVPSTAGQPSQGLAGPAQPGEAPPVFGQPVPGQSNPAHSNATAVPGRSSPAQPSPAQPSPAQPNPAQPVQAQPIPQQYSAQPYSAQPYSAQPYSAQPYSAQPYAAQAYAAQPYSAVPYSAQPYSAQPYPGQPLSQQYSAPPAYGQPVSGYPYGPYQANPWGPAPLPMPRRSGGALRWIGGILALVLVLSVVAVGGLVGYADYTGRLDTQAAWKPGAGPQIELPPAQNAPASEWTSWARRSVSDTLAAQAKALVDANEEAYLAAVDPDNSELVADHKRRFKVLRAMGPGVWTQGVTGPLADSGERSWQADVKISYCFGAATCSPVQLVESSTWNLKSDHLVMIGLEQSKPNWNGPRPWETDDLTVLTGQRVVMAATKSNAWRLPEAVKSADRAALVADTLAKWESPPSRFVIFLAGANDWKRWYGHSQPEWAAAWAVPVSATATEVVVRTEVVQQRGLETLLTHELTHVTTLAGKRDGAGSSAWWLIEGIADYATMIGKSVSSYDSIVPTRSFVRNKWDGDPAVDAPTVSAPLEEASARYGVAFLAVRRISDKYGQDKMLNFWGRVVHDNIDLNAASTAVLGAPWDTVKADSVKFIRTSVS